MNLIKLCKDIISPKKCYSCGKEGHFLCLSCYKQLHNFEPICFISKLPSKDFEIKKEFRTGLYFSKVIILTHYKNPIIKKLIKDGKFYKRKDIFEDFGKYLSKMLIKYEKNVHKSGSLLVPIPVHFLRRLQRGYNQSEILASEISNRTGLNCISDLLKKHKYTGQQSKISKQGRGKNLNNSFTFNKKYNDKFDNFQIILVDDVVSTGSTLNEAAKVLYEQGFNDIICITIASD